MRQSIAVLQDNDGQSAMKKILIMMTDTGGGGHRASAEALRDAFHKRYGQRFRVDMVDLWMKHTPPPLNQVPKAYRFLVDDVPWLYRFIYEVGQKPEVIDPMMEAAARFLQPFVRRTIQERDPDLIVSVHPLMQAIPLNVLKRMQRRVPFVTVVTDWITIPPVWFDADATLCVVPSEEGYQQALRAGLRPQQVRKLGLPIRPAFARKPRPKVDLREGLGMVRELPAALVVSGGEGMGRVGEIAQAVSARLAAEGRRKPAGQLAVICGRNQELLEALSVLPWPVPTVIEGFVEEIWDWMAACDCVITKAGPGTIAEALALGLPILLSGYIPGQETGNVPYVLKNGVGVYVEDPWQIAEVIAGWFGPQREQLGHLAENARRLGRPQAAFEIIEELVQLLESPVQR
jgi:1,2-diacylglycerol 3-beta-galactosyltransferase